MLHTGEPLSTARLRRPALLLVAAAVLVTTGCDALSPPPGTLPATTPSATVSTSPSTSSSADPDAEPDASQAAAPDTSKRTRRSAHLSLATFADVVLTATASVGSVHAVRVETEGGLTTELTGDTRFAGDYQGRIMMATVPAGAAVRGSTPRSELRLVGGRVYVHVPGSVPPGKFLSQGLDQDTSALGGACACMFSHVEPTETLQTMRQSLTKVVYLGRERVGGRPSEHYRLEADTAMIPGVVDAAHPRTTRVYQVWLDSRHLLQRLTYTTSDKSVDVAYSRWGERVQVATPAASTLIPVPSTGATGT